MSRGRTPNPFRGPAETVELRTIRAATVPGGCGAVPSFEGEVQLGSFLGQHALHRPHAALPGRSAALTSGEEAGAVSKLRGGFSLSRLYQEVAAACDMVAVESPPLARRRKPRVPAQAAPPTAGRSRRLAPYSGDIPDSDPR